MTATAHRYYASSREVQVGDAAYLLHDAGEGWSAQFVPVIVVRVNRVSLTLAGRDGVPRRLPHNADRNNNVGLAWAGSDEDDEHDLIRARLR